MPILMSISYVLQYLILFHIGSVLVRRLLLFVSAYDYHYW